MGATLDLQRPFSMVFLLCQYANQRKKLPYLFNMDPKLKLECNRNGKKKSFPSHVSIIGICGVGGKSNIEDFTLGAEACIPIISAILSQTRKQAYPVGCFVNIGLPTNVAQHKGYKLTRQGKRIYKMGWRHVTSDMQGGKMLSTMTMDTDSVAPTETGAANLSQGHLTFKRELRGAPAPHDEEDTDYKFLQECFITVTPLGALSRADDECHAFFENWLPSLVDRPSPLAL